MQIVKSYFLGKIRKIFVVCYIGLLRVKMKKKKKEKETIKETIKDKHLELDIHHFKLGSSYYLDCKTIFPIKSS